MKRGSMDFWRYVLYFLLAIVIGAAAYGLVTRILGLLK